MKISLIIPVVNLQETIQVFNKALSLIVLREEVKAGCTRVLMGTQEQVPFFWLKEIPDFDPQKKRWAKEVLK